MKLIKLPRLTTLKSIFTGKNSEDLNSLIKESTFYGLTETNQIAYVLATAKHETANFDTMFEYGKKGVDPVTYFNSQYSHRTDLGNTPGTNDGYTYRGRGYVQITGKYNYDKMGKIFDADFVGNPDLVATPEYAAKIAAYGMANGSFRTKQSVKQSVSIHINADKTDYYGAREIINGDKSVNGQKIADYAKELDIALEKMLQNTDIPLTMDARTEKTAVTLIGGKGADVIYGGSGNDSLSGGNGNDSLSGGNGKDQIDGGLGKDTIYGGEGADLLKAGKEPNVQDMFIYKNITESTKANHDNIYNFEKGIDKLVLTGLGFTKLDTNGGQTVAGELRFNANSLLSDQADFRIDFYSGVPQSTDIAFG
jgi:predicted chitinase